MIDTGMIGFFTLCNLLLILVQVTLRPAVFKNRIFFSILNHFGHKHFWEIILVFSKLHKAGRCCIFVLLRSEEQNKFSKSLSPIGIEPAIEFLLN